MTRRIELFLLAVVAMAQVATMNSHAQSVLTNHMREVVRTRAAQPVGRLPLDQIMTLDIVLPLRDHAGLEKFLSEVYDPSSPSYRHFLTVPEFTQEFGPTQADYDAVVQFAKDNGFTVIGGTRDGMNVQINGSVSAVESAFHVTMRTYQHPTESRIFYAPDSEPTLDLSIPVWHISGLDNYSIPHPMLVKKSDYAAAHGISPDAVVSHATTGSGPSASFLGSDMRAAYYGGSTLTGAGQNVGLFEFLGTDLADLTTYFKNIGQTNNVPVTLLSTDGTSTACVDTSAGGKCDDTEQTLDMTQALGMAPGLASLVVYVGSTDTAIISAMTTHNPLPMTIGCSWGWTPADQSTLDPYFERMAAQGQNFFAASGDSSTWSSKIEAWPADDAHVVSVGGTDLITASAGGPWKSETAWVDSGGGISPDNIAIPSWQQLSGVINSGNKGSTTLRNGPDVSANANFTFYTCSNQTACLANAFGGTSFAAPMWAGYIALVDQQLAEKGEPAIGFINPTIYAQNITSSYSTDFHDITSGTSGSFSATAGYDLVTGWGSPNGIGLINALAPTTASCTTKPNAPTGLAASGTSSTGTTLSWTADTAPANCSVSSYTVLKNGASIGTATGTSFAVTGLSASTAYSFTVEATDADGTSAASSALSVTTAASGTGEAPYGGTAAAIPGTVQAENYDTGGQGFGYSVSSSNGTDNGYRSDGVDLEVTTDTGGGVNVGWTASGQWFRYTVNVATAGSYTVSFRVASPTAVTDAFHLSNSSGTNLSGPVNVPATGGYQIWTTVTATVTLPAGKQTLTLNQDHSGWNINWFSFAGGGGTTEGPYGGTPQAIAGTVLAEKYDTGGQGVAYNVTSVNGTDNGFRSDGVDLETTSAPGGGNNIGWTATGQWFRYTVNVATAGTYTVTFEVASLAGVTDAFHISNS
jgi:kumamolisin